MKERPILFSAPMIRALLANQKTQTRRIIDPIAFGAPSHCKEVKPYCTGTADPLAFYWKSGACWNSSKPLICRHGKKGDRLWVKETFIKKACERSLDEPCLDCQNCRDGRVFYADTPEYKTKWKPSIFMPRWASRITLEILSVRVERLQDISEEDAKAEGCEMDGKFPKEQPHSSGIGLVGWDSAIDWYHDLWDSINGKGSWELNPVVWVLEFKMI